MSLQKCIKLIGIYQLFILQFTIINAQGQTSEVGKENCSEQKNGDSTNGNASNLLTSVNNKLIPFCTRILKCQYCKKYYLGIVIPIITFIVLLLFFQYICIKCCRSSKSRKQIKNEEDLRMSSYDKRHCQPHGHMYQGKVYGENMQQVYMFPGEEMQPNKHRQPFIYEQAEEPRKKKKKKKYLPMGDLKWKKLMM